MEPHLPIYNQQDFINVHKEFNGRIASNIVYPAPPKVNKFFRVRDVAMATRYRRKNQKMCLLLGGGYTKQAK